MKKYLCEITKDSPSPATARVDQRRPISVIKILRNVTNCQLADGKDIVVGKKKFILDEGTLIDLVHAFTELLDQRTIDDIRVLLHDPAPFLMHIMVPGDGGSRFTYVNSGFILNMSKLGQ